MWPHAEEEEEEIRLALDGVKELHGGMGEGWDWKDIKINI